MLEDIIKAGTVPIYDGVDYDADSYIKRTPKYKIIKKYLHKKLSLYLGGQSKLRVDKLNKNSKILLLYTGKDSIGDSILELSGRALLKGMNVNLDLLTLPNLYHVYKEDDIFKKVYFDIKDLDKNYYDAILLVEYNYKSIQLKKKYFKNLPYACMFGYFDGPDRSQCYYSYFAINDIFNLNIQYYSIIENSCPYLNVESNSSNKFTYTDYFVIAVGGVDKKRTYHKWIEFLKLVDANISQQINFILLGSENGLNIAGEINNTKFNNIKIYNHVGMTTLLEAREIIHKANLFIGCDGGLMHVAHSTPVPSITIFNYAEPFYIRLTKKNRYHPIQSEEYANNIDAKLIYDKFLYYLQ